MRRVLLAAAAMLMVVVATPVAAYGATGLTATATPDSGKPGAQVRVDGANWAPNAHLQIVTCGALGIGGSASCDQAATYTPIADKNGVFQAYVALGKPPVPCPCVLHVSDATSTDAVDIPVVVVGQPTAPPPQPDVSAAQPLTVVSAQLTGWGPWTAFFGAGPQRTMVITVHNSTSRTITSARLSLATGTADSPGRALALTTVGPITAGTASTFQVPVTLPGGVGGSYTVTGTLDGAATFSATTSSYAWGFYVLDVLLLLVLILAIVARRRRLREDVARASVNGGKPVSGPEPSEEVLAGQSVAPTAGDVVPFSDR